MHPEGCVSPVSGHTQGTRTASRMHVPDNRLARALVSGKVRA